MASARVEHMLDEIARLSREEQAELVEHLPRVLDRGVQVSQLTAAAVQTAIQLRESFRARAKASGRKVGSLEDELDEVRDSRLSDLAGTDTAAETQS